MAFPPASGLIVSDAADLGDRQLTSTVPLRSHLVPPPAAPVDYATELPLLKAELFLLTVRVQQLEARLPALASLSIWERVIAWWTRVQTRWRS